MKIQVHKHSNHNLEVWEMDQERMSRFPNGEMFEIDIKLGRNPQFHRKVFKFLSFCFAYWKADKNLEFVNENEQFEHFRSKLTISAGYFYEAYNLDGSVELKPKSLSYASMDQGEFEAFYQSAIAAAMRTIFPGCGSEIEDQLLGFF